MTIELCKSDGELFATKTKAVRRYKKAIEHAAGTRTDVKVFGPQSHRGSPAQTILAILDTSTIYRHSDATNAIKHC